MIGWASLLVAAGGSYILAKREIESRRKMQREAGKRDTEKKEWYDRLGDPNANNPLLNKTSTTSPLEPSAADKPPDKT
ncbi:hypothetical protein FRB96_007087 [Tulasnella sp. 330]|nr:hypothetical protein FRB96_007087 [Tulasnella sp. 330]KAG8887175.1 hypothetical protein FRB98_000385 [Tulasnella sp. 332]